MTFHIGRRQRRDERDSRNEAHARPHRGQEKGARGRAQRSKGPATAATRPKLSPHQAEEDLRLG